MSVMVYIKVTMNEKVPISNCHSTRGHGSEEDKQVDMTKTPAI